MSRSNPTMRAVCSVFLLVVSSLVTGCGGGGEGDPAISSFTTQTGAAVSLSWDPVQDPTVYAYYVHYGRESAGQPGACNYSDSMYVSGPSATIIGLDPDTRYYFAVSAYNGLRGACSNEVSTVTPASLS